MRVLSLFLSALVAVNALNMGELSKQVNGAKMAVEGVTCTPLGACPDNIPACIGGVNVVTGCTASGCNVYTCEPLTTATPTTVTPTTALQCIPQAGWSCTQNIPYCSNGEAEVTSCNAHGCPAYSCPVAPAVTCTQEPGYSCPYHIPACPGGTAVVTACSIHGCPAYTCE